MPQYQTFPTPPDVPLEISDGPYIRRGQTACQASHGRRRTERETPEITAAGGRDLLASVDCRKLVGLRDRAIIAILIYTASRAGAVAKLRRGSFYDGGDQWMLHFDEKGGKSREIPVRHDLEKIIFAYIDAAELRDATKEFPMFRTTRRKTGELNENAVHVLDICQGSAGWTGCKEISPFYTESDRNEGWQ